jgi:drug/metabolite transporter (DMT)-like permease
MAILLSLCAIWGFTQVTIKLANTGVSPLTQAGLRSAGSALFLWAYARASGVPLFRRDRSLGFGLLIAAMFAGEFVFLYWGLVYTTAARGILFIYTAPFVVALGAHWFIPGERLRRLRVVGLLCAFTGLAIAFADGLRLPTRRELLGDSMELVAAILWGATIVLIKASRHRLSPHKTLFYQLAGSAPMLLGLAWLVGEPGLTRATPLVLGSLAYQIVVVAFASYLAWFWLLGHYPAAPLAAFAFWTPIFGMLAGWLVLGERVTPALAVAILLVAAGIYVVNQTEGARRA